MRLSMLAKMQATEDNPPKHHCGTIMKSGRVQIAQDESLPTWECPKCKVAETK